MHKKTKRKRGISNNFIKRNKIFDNTRLRKCNKNKVNLYLSKKKQKQNQDYKNILCNGQWIQWQMIFGNCYQKMKNKNIILIRIKFVAFFINVLKDFNTYIHKIQFIEIQKVPIFWQMKQEQSKQLILVQQSFVQKKREQRKLQQLLHQVIEHQKTGENE
ncbi:unnamed protein product [Paramecium sonneborni]|uniref:Uncharacterized protein n=1 Tax=Paramecium sonneborni TaxID=65129 RepID=A0A8S1K209_9CILI|nr:unnamed protein product [Paramecium sonneborni]